MSEVVIYYVWMHTDRWHTTGERAEEISRKALAEGKPLSGDVRSIIATLPPGNFRVDVEFGNQDSEAALGLEIAFTDAAGKHWVRRSDGTLHHRKMAAIEHYGIPDPITYRTFTTVT